MKQFPRILMVFAALGLLALFIFPMWRISLYAPQYPTGVTMFIYINKIGGTDPGTLQNVNILNHYVGMKPIVPESIPELKFLPIVVIIFVVLGLIIAFINRPKLFLTWAILATFLSLLGIYDFYLWEYDYGHSLSPNAPMKFPGASFQPPLFGSKVILNFIAKSFPHTGGYFAGLSALLAVAAWWLKSKMSKNETQQASFGSGDSAKRSFLHTVA